MIANIRGGMSMVADFSTVISFVCLIGLKMLTNHPLDCLG
jgi:hypothetical protein